LLDQVVAKARGEPIDEAVLDWWLASAVTEVVKQQIGCGLDIVNNGELSKPNFTDYVLERIAGCEKRPGTGLRRLSMTARDERNSRPTSPRIRARDFRSARRFRCVSTNCGMSGRPSSNEI
jgi:methionine synthase II (cobalamin-independent)